MSSVRRASPPIAITIGDPAGVGPELALRVVRGRRDLVLVGSRALLERVAKRLKLPLPGRIDEVEVPGFDAAAVVPGRVQPAAGAAAAAWVAAAARGCLNGRYRALVTCPINKESLAAAGVPFPGHTELLAALCAEPPGAAATTLPAPARYAESGEAMLMYDRRIAVALVTCHQSLASVPATLTTERIVQVGLLLAGALRRLRRGEPTLAVCGLNCHAGEHGLFGEEEGRIIAPAVAELNRQGIRAEGPLPPDTAFMPAKRQRYAGYLCMYHDQGLIPFKALAFDAGVNVTLGLPIVRTSVDHGTAFDIAWKGKASPASLRSAIALAGKLARG